MSDKRTPNRRDVLKGAATLGTISLAGCSGGGGDGDGPVTLTIGGTSQGSSTQAAGQAFAQAANQHSDVIEISVQVTDGWTANLYEYDSGEIPGMGVDNNSLAKALNGGGPFADEPVDQLPHQGFQFTSLDIHMVALESSGVESTEDLREGGYTIYPIQPGFGTRLLTEEILRDAGLWEQNEINNSDTSDIPGAVEEGRVDVLCLYGSNGVELSGWCQEVDVRSGGELQLIEIGDELRQTVEDNPGALLNEREAYGYEQEVDPLGVGETVMWSLAGQWAYGPEVPAEATREMARLAIEHAETIRESDPTTPEYTPELMANTVIPELEVHEGLVNFFEDEGVWQDNWTRGEAE